MKLEIKTMQKYKGTSWEWNRSRERDRGMGIAVHMDALI